jgi:hypothetical protein
MTSAAPSSDDISQYHPHDIQIMKYFPDKNIPAFYENGMAFASLYENSRNFEKLGIQPPRVPWPLPPPRPRDSLEAGVEEWRTTALDAIDSRLAVYAHRPAVQPVSDTKSVSSYIQTHEHTPVVLRVLLIPELLEMILQYAAPSTQYTAWNVNTTWRSTIKHILGSRHRSAGSQKPVDYGQVMETSPLWLQPSEEEIAEIEQFAATLSSKTHREATERFFPARIVQARALSLEASTAIYTAWERFYQQVPQSLSQATDEHWCDLSQLRFNPYFLDLYSGRVQLKLGRCEITLRPGTQRLLYKRLLPEADFTQLIGSMFLTDPPCKAIGVYVPRVGSGSLEPVAKILDVDGIRVGHLLSTLQEHCNVALDTWHKQAEKLRRDISESHWIKFTANWQKRYPWSCPGFPKFTVFFEQVEEISVPIAKVIHYHGEDFEGLCFEEWHQ